MKILLVGNYENDQQESMARFATMLESGLTEIGHEVRLVKPKPRIGKLKKSVSGVGKWLGYVDKFALFPADLKRAMAWADVVHICDHSNAYYSAYLKGKPHLVTCHDLLAVRGALGQDTDCPASRTGKILQQWILKGLLRSQMVVCVSNYTRQDFETLAAGKPHGKLKVIFNGLNHSYQVLEKTEASSRLGTLSNKLAQRPYILHVGSSLRRKNREGILRIFQLLRDRWNGQLVFAGAPLTGDQTELLQTLNLKERVTHVAKPSNSQLEALYNQAHAFLFPSRFEGFGWPIIEAQACGCPVVCSDRCSLPEVAADSALVRAIEDEQGFASDLLKLSDHSERKVWVERGLKNIERFSTGAMVDRYVEAYQDVMRG